MYLIHLNVVSEILSMTFSLIFFDVFCNIFVIHLYDDLKISISNLQYL